MPRAATRTSTTPWSLIAAGVAIGSLAAYAVSRPARRSVPLVGGQLPAGATLYTIIFENHGRLQVLGPNAPAPFFKSLANDYLDLQAYRPRIHPSLPAYIQMVSGSVHGITDDVGFTIPGTDNLAAQMDAAGVPWRAYAESMPSPCYRRDTRLYAPRHVPWLYFDYVTGRPAYCAEHVVPMEPGLWSDRDSRYVWITPNLQSDAHDASVATADAWLANVLPRIMALPGYQNGGAIVILFDEAYGAESSVPAIVVSESVRGRGADLTVFDHRSYLAAVQDLLGLPRLPVTQGVPSIVRGMP